MRGRRLWPLALVLMTFALSACQEVRTVLPAGIQLTQEQLTNVRIAKIQVDTSDFVENSRIASTLEARLTKDVSVCATGSNELNLHVRIDGYKEQSAGATLLVGDGINLDGLIELKDPHTGTLVGEYYNSAFYMSGGLIGLLALSDAEQKLTTKFASQLCAQLFHHPLPEKPEKQDT